VGATLVDARDSHAYTTADAMGHALSRPVSIAVPQSSRALDLGSAGERSPIEFIDTRAELAMLSDRWR
jgi:hypothetical protein